MEMLWICVVAVIVYLFCPKHLKLVILIANIFIPDSIPVIDEVIMVAGLLIGDN